MTLVLGVDASTQSTKVEVRDAEDGHLVASGRALHPPTTPPRSEQDPQAWWDALVAAVRQAGVGDIAAMSVAAQQHGMVVLDAEHHVLRAAKLWNDTESAPQAARMVEKLSRTTWARLCGSVPTAAFTITKLSWLREVEYDQFARLRHLLLPHDWLIYRLTGAFVTDRGDASGTGYWSPAEERWRPDLLASTVDPAVDWQSVLPRVLPPLEVAGELTRAAADDLGLRPGIPVACGTGDNMAAALGVNLDPGAVVMSIGTSGTVYTRSATPTADEAGYVAGFADAAGGYLPLVCTLNATKVTDAFMRWLGVAPQQFDEMALVAPPGAGGVTLLPYFDGERTPNLPDAVGLLSGLRTHTSREQIARTAVEGVVCGLLDGLDALAGAGAKARERIILIGGGAASTAYRRVVADLSQTEVLIPEPAEYVARGACRQAAASIGCADLTGTQWRLRPSATVAPSDGGDVAGLRDRYRALRDAAVVGEGVIGASSSKSARASTSGP